MREYRFYSFVAGLYLSPIQCGIQTAHVVSALSISPQPVTYRDWAQRDKTIIVWNALTSGGVLRAFDELQKYKSLGIKSVLFSEDEESLGGAVTAAGCIISNDLYDTKPANLMSSIDTGVYVYEDPDYPLYYRPDTLGHDFITWLKGFKLV